MEKVKNNIIFKLIVKLISTIEVAIQESFIYSIFTKNIESKKVNSDIIYKIIGGLRRVFRFLKLDKVFKDSIFAKTYIWAGLAVALAPMLSTVQNIVVILMVILSFILKVCLDDNFKFKFSPVNKAVVVFAIIYLLSAFFSFNMTSSLKIALVGLSFIVFYFVIINSIETEKQLQTILQVFIVVGVIISLLGVYQYFNGGAFSSSSYVDKEMFEDIETRVTSTFDNPNVLGEYLLFIIPLAVSALFENKNYRIKFLYLVGVGIMCICLALTYSRGCYLGLIFSLAIFVLLWNFKTIILFVLGLVAAPFVLPKSILNRFTSIGNLADSSTSYRISIWKGSIDMIKEYWYRPIGQGTTAFNSIYPLYAYNGVGAQHTHNLFLQLIVELSIFGLLSFVWLLFRFYQYILSGIRLAKNNIYLIGFISGMSGFLLQSIFDNTWYNNRIVLIFWIFIGMAVKTRQLVTKDI